MNGHSFSNADALIISSVRLSVSVTTFVMIRKLIDMTFAFISLTLHVSCSAKITVVTDLLHLQTIHLYHYVVPFITSVIALVNSK